MNHCAQEGGGFIIPMEMAFCGDAMGDAMPPTIHQLLSKSYHLQPWQYPTLDTEHTENDVVSYEEWVE